MVSESEADGPASACARAAGTEATTSAASAAASAGRGVGGIGGRGVVHLGRCRTSLHSATHILLSSTLIAGWPSTALRHDLVAADVCSALRRPTPVLRPPNLPLLSERLRIRSATSADAELLAALAEQTFRDTFADDNEAADMEAYVRDSFSPDQVRTELDDGASTFLLAFVDGGERPAGYAKLRTGTTDPSVRGPDPVELERLYVDRSAIGHGIGAALMRASLEAARSSGHRTLWLGVWERNARAISFYERWGFETVGDHVFRLGSDDQTDLIMERSVSGP